MTEGACAALDMQLIFVGAGKPSPAEIPLLGEMPEGQKGSRSRREKVPRNEADEESTEKRNIFLRTLPQSTPSTASSRREPRTDNSRPYETPFYFGGKLTGRRGRHPLQAK